MFWRARCGGFSNKTLLAGLGLLALVFLLTMLQAGDIGIPALGQGPAKPGKSSGSSKSPPMLLSPPDVLEDVADEFIAQRQATLKQDSRVKRETWQAFARMDARAAATILGEMSPTEAVRILSHLRERDLARILPEAHPQDAQEWVTLLAKDLDLEAIPPEFSDRARAAGLPVNLDELLVQSGLAAGMPTSIDVAGIDEQPGQPVSDGDQLAEPTTDGEQSADTEDISGTADPLAEPPGSALPDNTPSDAADPGQAVEATPTGP